VQAHAPPHQKQAAHRALDANKLASTLQIYRGSERELEVVDRDTHRLQRCEPKHTFTSENKQKKKRIIIYEALSVNGTSREQISHNKIPNE
jgi:hypothetical protein